MKFSIVTEFGFIDECYKEFLPLTASFHMVQITVNYHFAARLIQIFIFRISHNHPLSTASDLTLGLVGFVLVF